MRSSITSEAAEGRSINTVAPSGKHRAGDYCFGNMKGRHNQILAAVVIIIGTRHTQLTNERRRGGGGGGGSFKLRVMRPLLELARLLPTFVRALVSPRGTLIQSRPGSGGSKEKRIKNWVIVRCLPWRWNWRWRNRHLCCDSAYNESLALGCCLDCRCRRKAAAASRPSFAPLPAPKRRL